MQGKDEIIVSSIVHEKPKAAKYEVKNGVTKLNSLFQSESTGKVVNSSASVPNLN